MQCNVLMMIIRSIDYIDYRRIGLNCVFIIMHYFVNTRPIIFICALCHAVAFRIVTLTIILYFVPLRVCI